MEISESMLDIRRLKMLDNDLCRQSCKFDDVQKYMSAGWSISIALLEPYHYLGFVEKVSGRVITMTDNTVIIVTK